MYDVLSPDGLPINCGEVYQDVDEAHAAAVAFAKRYERQGYYWSAQRERIPVEDIAGRCCVIEVPDDYLEEDDDD